MQTITSTQIETITAADTFEEAMQTLGGIAPGFEGKVAFIAAIRGNWYPARWVETRADASLKAREAWEVAKFGRKLTPAER